MARTSTSMAMAMGMAMGMGMGIVRGMVAMALTCIMMAGTVLLITARAHNIRPLILRLPVR